MFGSSPAGNVKLTKIAIVRRDLGFGFGSFDWAFFCLLNKR